MYQISDRATGKVFKYGDSAVVKTAKDGTPVRIYSQLRALARDSKYFGRQFVWDRLAKFSGRRASHADETSRIRKFKEEYGCRPEGNKNDD